MKTKNITVQTPLIQNESAGTTTIVPSENNQSLTLKKSFIMNSKEIIVETPLAPKELTDTLRSITVTDFSQLYDSPNAQYYGEINSYSFQIMNVKYGPMSSFPPIQGEIQDSVNKTTVNIKMDIKSHFQIARAMYFNTLIPIGLIVMLLSILVLGGTDYQIHGILFSSSFILCAVLVVALTKSSLISTKKKELKNFVSKINGKIISE